MNMDSPVYVCLECGFEGRFEGRDGEIVCPKCETLLDDLLNEMEDEINERPY